MLRDSKMNKINEKEAKKSKTNKKWKMNIFQNYVNNKAKVRKNPMD